MLMELVIHIKMDLAFKKTTKVDMPYNPTNETIYKNIYQLSISLEYPVHLK